MTTANRSTLRMVGALLLAGAFLGACSAPATVEKVNGLAAAQSANATVVPIQSQWRYLDSGSVPDGWSSPAFDDLGWAVSAGPLGAGNSGLRSVINRTAPAHLVDLFRTGFTVDSPTAFDRIDLRLLADDAAIVRLNGSVILNDNVRSDGYPEQFRGGAEENRYRDFAVDSTLLQPGLNVVAVELHQDHKEDPDSAFDLSVSLHRKGQVSTTTTAPSPPTNVAKPAPPTPTTTAPTAATTSTTAPPAIGSPGTAPAGWSTLYWSDEFNSSSLDASKWKPYHNTYGDGNNEMACLTPDNVSVAGGSLRISARRESITCPGGKLRQFTSGFLGTRETGTYFPAQAYYEIRAKLPHGQGLWPAFWLRHRNGASTAEVDIMEYFHSQAPGRTTQTLHLDGRSNVTKKGTAFESPTSQPGWHTWGVAIEKVAEGWRFTLYTDGVAVHTYLDKSANWATSAPADGTFDIAVNMAVGGNWVGDPDGPLGALSSLGRCANGGTYPNSCESTNVRRASFPSTYEVDYVRVFTR